MAGPKEITEVAGVVGPDPDQKVLAGPVPTPLNAKEIMLMAMYFCTVHEIANAYDLTERQMYRRFAQDPELRRGFIKGRADGRRSIKRHQFLMAVGNEGKGVPPDAGMLRWLGQNILGQSSRHTKIVDDLDKTSMDSAIDAEYEEIQADFKTELLEHGHDIEPEPGTAEETEVDPVD